MAVPDRTLHQTGPDPVSLVASLALIALGSLLLLAALDVVVPSFALLAPAVAGALGAILLAAGLVPVRRARDARRTAAIRTAEGATPAAGGGVAPPVDGSEGFATSLHRTTRSRLIGGVCAGLAETLGIAPGVVRAAFVAAFFAGGAGAALYAVAWLAMPLAPGSKSDETPTGPRPAEGAVAIALGVATVTLAVLLTFRSLGLWAGDAVVWPVALVAGGAALLWRRGRTEPDPAAPTSPHEPPRESAGEVISRTGLGVALVVAAALVFLQLTGALGAARDALLAVVVAAAVLGVIFAPTIVRLGRSRDAERAERTRSQERAELAAHLHDSVLQTLALLQQRADDPRAVAQLARRQERELRRWLAGRAPLDGAPSTLAAALEAAAEDVERDHAVDVDVVTVGDIDLDDQVRALLGAAREAMVNAARHGGAGPVAVYAEARAGRVEVDVRDRGPGFVLADVPPQRRGVRESIIGRMARHGGTARIGPAAGGGTEVELVLERAGREP